jgi:hypothetical protein
LILAKRSLKAARDEVVLWAAAACWPWVSAAAGAPTSGSGSAGRTGDGVGIVGAKEDTGAGAGAGVGTVADAEASDEAAAIKRSLSAVIELFSPTGRVAAGREVSVDVGCATG